MRNTRLVAISAACTVSVFMAFVWLNFGSQVVWGNQWGVSGAGWPVSIPFPSWSRNWFDGYERQKTIDTTLALTVSLLTAPATAWFTRPCHLFASHSAACLPQRQLSAPGLQLPRLRMDGCICFG
jgi:hypothetical protein